MAICIIGGSSSLGRELISQAKNEKIIATYNRNEIKANIDKVQLNLLDDDQVNKFRPKNIHHLIFAQGILIGNNMGNYKTSDINDTIHINLISCLNIINNFISLNCFKNPALITFISSIAAENGSYDSVYASSKSGLIGCAKSIAKYHAPNLRANVICPGLIEDSGMYNLMTVNDHKKHILQTPTKQLTSIKHLSEIIYNLDSDCFSNLNGAVININGGRFV